MGANMKKAMVTFLNWKQNSRTFVFSVNTLPHKEILDSLERSYFGQIIASYTRTYHTNLFKIQFDVFPDCGYLGT